MRIMGLILQSVHSHSNLPGRTAYIGCRALVSAKDTARQCLRHCFFVFIAGALLVNGVSAWATIAIDPEVQRIDAKPGQKVKGSIFITNETAQDMHIEVQPEDWSAKPKLRNISWLKVYPKNFVLKPGKTKKVKFKAIMPDTGKRAYMSQVFFAFKDKKKSNLNIGMRVASLLYFKTIDTALNGK